MIERLQREEGAQTNPSARIAAILGGNTASLSPAQLDEIAQFLRRLERDPTGVQREFESMHPQPNLTTLLMRWLVDSHDVNVSVMPWITAFMSPAARSMPQLVLGASMGMAAFQIEHRAERLSPTSDAVQIAGVESASRSYEAAVRGGAAHIAALDEIVSARDRGLLASWFAAHRAVRPPRPH